MRAPEKKDALVALEDVHAAIRNRWAAGKGKLSLDRKELVYQTNLRGNNNKPLEVRLTSQEPMGRPVEILFCPVGGETPILRLTLVIKDNEKKVSVLRSETMPEQMGHIVREIDKILTAPPARQGSNTPSPMTAQQLLNYL